MIICPMNALERYEAIIPGLREALEVISQIQDYTPRTIPLSGNNRILIQEVTSKSVEGRACEAHRKFLDVQCIVDGQEVMGWAPVSTLTPTQEFNEETDCGMYTGKLDYVRIDAGYCYVVFPEDAHLPNSHIDTPCTYRKMVIKLAL